MTGLESLKEEMMRRGMNKSQCDSKVVAVVLDILSGSGTHFTEEWKDRQDLDKERCAFERDKKHLQFEALRLDKEIKEIENYLDRFFDGLENCETDEGRDAMKRAQMFVNTVDPKTAYDNTAFIIGLASILSNGKTAPIDELRKINRKIPGVDEWTEKLLARIGK